MVFIGVDPGLKGAIAIIYDYDVKDPEIYRFANMDKIVEALKKLKPEETVVCIEDLVIMPFNSIKASAAYHRNFGIWEGILTALGFKWKTVLPKKWQGDFFSDLEKPKNFFAESSPESVKARDEWRKVRKNASRKRASELSENTEIFSLVTDDGKAEAYLIAVYAMNSYM